MKIKEYFSELGVLYMLFLRIGLFTIGGGYVMLPMIRREVVERRKWADDQELLNWFAISQVVPGIIAINTATFTGYKRRGIAGAAAATAGMVTPSLVIIILIAMFIPAMQSNVWFQKAFQGIRVAMTVMLFAMIVDLFRKGKESRVQLFITLAAFAGVACMHWSPVPVILVTALAGFLFAPFRKQQKADS